MVTTKEGIVTLRVAGLAVPGCKGLSTIVRSPTYAVLLQNQFCHELCAHGRGGSQKVTYLRYVWPASDIQPYLGRSYLSISFQNLGRLVNKLAKNSWLELFSNLTIHI